MLRPIPQAESFVTISDKPDALATFANHCRTTVREGYVTGRTWADDTQPRTDAPHRFRWFRIYAGQSNPRIRGRWSYASVGGKLPSYLE